MAPTLAGKPLHQKIFEHLHQDLMTGRYQPGQKFPSEAALVKRFSASRITVGHALRQLAELGLIDRIAGSGNWVRERRRAAGEELLFGLIIPNLGETEIFEPICRAIATAPEGHGHALLWAHSEATAAGRGEQVLQLAGQCIARRVDGVFFAPLELAPEMEAANRKVFERLAEARIPVVVLDRRPEEAYGAGRCDSVGIDNHRAGWLATRHLIGLGARRIGFVSWENQATTVAARARGYQSALAEAGLEPGRIFRLPGELSDCDAFVCANDRIAGEVMHALLARGVRIPGEVRIVGIDDVNYAALLPVPLTTVHQPCREIGEAALRMMMERLERPALPARDLRFDCALVVRASCGGG